MSFRNFVHENVRHISVEVFGSGSITIASESAEDVVEGSLNAADQDFLEAIEVRQHGDQLRIDCHHRLFLTFTAHLSLGVPDGLTYSIGRGPADISVTAPISRSKIVSGSGDITITSAEDLICSTGIGRSGTGRADRDWGAAYHGLR